LFLTKELYGFVLITTLLCTSVSGTESDETWIRINQIGYRPSDPKFAVLVSRLEVSPEEFQVVDFLTGEPVYISKGIRAFGKYGPFITTFRLDFTPVQEQGKFFIRWGDTKSPVFRIGEQVYDGAADFLLKYMRQQRCGYNPFLRDSCHTHDGFTVYGPMPDGTHIDAAGGWHDAADYLQYATTSANATFNLLLAWRDYPGAFQDRFLASGLPGPNEVPDVLDEARWGLEWLQKMHPAPRLMFNQIADDRDHAGFRLPDQDSVSYGHGLERPVYFCSGDVQGLFGYKNRTNGVASTAGKFSSAFCWVLLSTDHLYLNSRTICSIRQSLRMSSAWPDRAPARQRRGGLLISTKKTIGRMIWNWHPHVFSGSRAIPAISIPA